MRTAFLGIVALLAAGCGKGKDADSASARTNPPLSYVPVAQWESYPFEDKPVRQYIPPNPRGVILFFHGTNGNVTIVQQIEPVAFLNLMIGEGIGFVSTDSGDQPAGKWIDGDVERVGRLYQHVIETTELEATDLLFTGGFSGGSNMAGNTAEYARQQGWPIKAILASQGSCFECGTIGIPTVWVLNENDLGSSQSGRDAHQQLKDAGVPTALYENLEETLTGSSFLKHPDMDAERSQRVFDDLIAKELIDAGGNRLPPVDEADQWCTWYANNGESYGPEGRAEELRVLWALHRFHAGKAYEVRDFLLDQK